MLGCFLRTISDKIPPLESHSVFSRDHRQSQVWRLKSLFIFPEQTQAGQRNVASCSPWGVRVRQYEGTQQTHKHSEKQDSGRQGDYTLYVTGPKSSISSLPSFSPVLAHLLGCKQICEHLSFHRCPSARSQTWADSAFLQPCSFSWTPFWPAFWGMKPATSSRVHPSSPLPYRLEGKVVSAWKGWEEGFGGCCQPSLDFFSKWAVELQYIFDSQKVSIWVLILIKLSHLILQNHECHLWYCLFLVSTLSLNVI